jgi:predicted PurR-regulated permease PerM
MQLKHLNVFFFLLLFLGVGVAVYFIFEPFLTAMIAAAVLTAILKKPYNWLEKTLRGRRTTSALLTCLLAVVVIIVPITVVSYLAIHEFSKFSVQISDEKDVKELLQEAVTKAEQQPVLAPLVKSGMFTQEKALADIQGLSQHVFAFAQKAYSSASGFLLWIFVLFFSLFYFLVDGKSALRYFMDLSPLKNEHDKLLIDKFISISRATLKGTLVIGFIQSALGGIAFAIAGVPSAATWAIIMIFFSVIPMVGTAIIWAPAGLILLALGHIWQGVFILLFGAMVIASIDNILRPKLVGRDTQMHPLLIFFATLGGIALFGLSGFVMGPIIVALFVALSEIYRIEFRDQLKEFNS